MAENRPEGDRMPEFGVNGAVLNNPSISEEVREDYIKQGALGAFHFAKHVSVKSPLSLLSNLLFIAVIFGFGYLIGRGNPRVSDNLDFYDILFLLLVLFSVLVDALIGRLKKRNKD